MVCTRVANSSGTGSRARRARSTGVVEWWSGGVGEPWSGGVVEWRSGGVAEWRSGGVAGGDRWRLSMIASALRCLFRFSH
jgi:hypothetical protein